MTFSLDCRELDCRKLCRSPAVGRDLTAILDKRDQPTEKNAVINGDSFNFQCLYQANVMKTFEIIRSGIVSVSW